MGNLPEGDCSRPKKAKIRVLLSTCPREAAEELARFLVEGRRAACVNIVPQVTSVYRWEGEIQSDTESLLIIKCPKKEVRATIEALVEKHPYKVPEVIALPVRDGHRAYIDWVSNSLDED